MFTKQTFKSKAEADKYLIAHHFIWVEQHQRWERDRGGIHHRAYVGQCRTGEWLITGA